MTQTPKSALDVTRTKPADRAEAVVLPVWMRSLFWHPQFRLATPLALYAPLLFWLTARTRPQRITVIGADDGFAHFLFCQAAENAGIPARVKGFGLWKDGTGAPTLKVPETLAAHARESYPDLSDLRGVRDLAEAIGLLPPQSVDLLFVDLTVLPDKAFPEIEALLTRLGPHGLFLLHGTGLSGGSPPMTQAGGRTIAFHQGRGLVLQVADDRIPVGLQPLLAGGEGIASEPAPDFVRMLRRLGGGVAAECDLQRSLAGEAEFAHALAETKRTLEVVRAELEALHLHYAAQTGRLAEVQSLLFDLTATGATDVTREQVLEFQLTVALRKRDNLQLDCDRLRADLDDANARCQAAGKALQEARAEAERHRILRFEETARLTLLLEQQRSELANQEARSAATVKEAQQARATLEQALAEERAGRLSDAAEATRVIDALRENQEALLASASWRITAPLRGIKTRLVRRP